MLRRYWRRSLREQLLQDGVVEEGGGDFVGADDGGDEGEHEGGVGGAVGGGALAAGLASSPNSFA